jgi:site-specific recombinase XerD
MPENESLELAVVHGLPTDTIDDRARDYARASKSANTRRAYASDWRDFETWCRETGRAALAASASTLALYLTERAKGLSVATLARRLASIRAVYAALGRAPPTGQPLDAVWAGIRRTHGRPPRAKRAICVPELRAMVRSLPDTPLGLRNKALLLVGFAGALRRSELAALELDGPGTGPVRARFVAPGIEILLDRSKGDQLGAGAVVAVPHGSFPDTCPVVALEAWIDRAGIAEGPIFRAIDRVGRVAGHAIADQTVALVVKAAARRLGVSDADLSGHSLRAGLATSAAENDAPAHVIMAHMRHASFDTTQRYIRSVDRFRRNAARIAGL